ncbi:MAG: hypothetical protein JWQ74_2352 [Marmoricola sp.]|nr:hypothetical protein [Marmoricola sp.]
MALKKVLPLLVVVFIGYYMFTDPSGLADLAKDGGAQGWDGLTKLFGAIIDFINAILS